MISLCDQSCVGTNLLDHNVISVMPSTDVSKQRGRRVFGLDLDGWNNVVVASFAIAAMAAIVGGIGTWWVIQLQKEDGAKLQVALKNADQRIAEAAERSAAASERAANAELALERLRQQTQPRRLDGNALVMALEARPKAPVEILFTRDDAEAFSLSMQIRDFLKMAGWEVSEPTALTRAHASPRLSQYPSAVGAGGQPAGVTVVARPVTQLDFAIEDNDALDSPYKALLNALTIALGSASGSQSMGEGPAPGVLRIVVGPKPLPPN
jgi:hypothetical protein